MAADVARAPDPEPVRGRVPRAQELVNRVAELAPADVAATVSTDEDIPHVGGVLAVAPEAGELCRVRQRLDEGDQLFLREEVLVLLLGCEGASAGSAQVEHAPVSLAGVVGVSGTRPVSLPTMPVSSSLSTASLRSSGNLEDSETFLFQGGATSIPRKPAKGVPEPQGFSPAALETTEQSRKFRGVSFSAVILSSLSSAAPRSRRLLLPGQLAHEPGREQVHHRRPDREENHPERPGAVGSREREYSGEPPHSSTLHEIDGPHPLWSARALGRAVLVRDARAGTEAPKRTAISASEGLGKVRSFIFAPCDGQFPCCSLWPFFYTALIPSSPRHEAHSSV